MELIIAHDKGWSCTNESEESYRIKFSDGVSTKSPLMVGHKIFNVVGVLERGIEAKFIQKYGMSYNCVILGVSNGQVTAEIKNVLTEEQTKLIINKIKNHGSKRKIDLHKGERP